MGVPLPPKTNLRMYWSNCKQTTNYPVKGTDSPGGQSIGEEVSRGLFIITQVMHAFSDPVFIIVQVVHAFSNPLFWAGLQKN